MKKFFVPEVAPISLHPKTILTGYDLKKVIEANEPPLQRLLREKKIPYYRKRDVKKRMRWLQLAANLKVGPLQFVYAVFKKQDTTRREDCILMPILLIIVLDLFLFGLISPRIHSFVDGAMALAFFISSFILMTAVVTTILEYGIDRSDIYELTRVEKKEIVETTTKWIEIV